MNALLVSLEIIGSREALPTALAVRFITRKRLTMPKYMFSTHGISMQQRHSEGAVRT